MFEIALTVFCCLAASAFCSVTEASFYSVDGGSFGTPKEVYRALPEAREE